MEDALHESMIHVALVYQDYIVVFFHSPAEHIDRVK